MKLRHSFATVSEEDVPRLHYSSETWHPVEVRPPRNEKISCKLSQFVRGVLEIQTKWFGLRNTSPVVAFEIRRPEPGSLHFQFAAPSRRMDRKIRTHLPLDVPGVEFSDGVHGLPVAEGDSVGGGLVTLGISDFYPIQREFQQPPVNALVSSLHRHVMQDTKAVVQVLFRPVIGKPVRRWLWRRRGYKQRNYLKKEKENLWGSINSTPREKLQAREIDDKIGSIRFHVSIRFIVIGAGRYTPSRVKELAGGFNVYELDETGQYFNAVTARSLRESELLDFANTVSDRRFGSWGQSFQLSIEELAGVVSLPDIQQSNIEYANP